MTARPANANTPDELTIAQAALHVDVSEGAICLAYMAGHLAFRVVGEPAAVRFVCTREDLEAWRRASLERPAGR